MEKGHNIAPLSPMESMYFVLSRFCSFLSFRFSNFLPYLLSCLSLNGPLTQILCCLGNTGSPAMPYLSQARKFLSLVYSNQRSITHQISIFISIHKMCHFAMDFLNNVLMTSSLLVCFSYPPRLSSSHMVI